MSDDISGEWLSVKGKSAPRYQDKKEKRRPIKKKAAVFKKDHLPSVHVSFSNTPPTPSTLLALQRKKQSKINLFFKPIQENREKDLCLNQHFPKYQQIKRVRKSNKECYDSAKQICQGSCVESKDSSTHSSYEESEENNDINDENNNYDDDISGVETIEGGIFSCENSSSEDDLDFSPIIHVNSQAKRRMSPLLKRRRISNDSENTLSGLNSPPRTEVANPCKPEEGIKKDKKCQPLSEKHCVVDRKADNYCHKRNCQAGSTQDVFTSQELSEIPPFTFNQISKVPHDKSVALSSVFQKKKELTTVQQSKTDSTNDSNWSTFTGVESESLGFTQWVQRQGERCKIIQNEVQSIETQDLLIHNQSDTYSQKKR